MADEAETAAPVETTTTAAETTQTTETKPETILETAGGEEKEVAVPATWPDDWRARMAGKDEATLKRLGRFTSPENVFKSFLQLEKKLSSGEAKQGLPENPTPEQVAEYRKANGIPEKADDYFSNLDGLVIGDADKPGLTAFAERMHSLNAPPAVVKEATKWYYETIEQQQAQAAEEDAQFRAETANTLRQEWGNNYKGNISLALSILDTAPPGLKENLLGARLADGRTLGDHPDALRWLTQLAHEINPASTVVPNAGASAGQAMTDEIASIEKRQREDRAGYFKDEAMQARYRDLLQARERMSAKAA